MIDTRHSALDKSLPDKCADRLPEVQRTRMNNQHDGPGLDIARSRVSTIRETIHDTKLDEMIATTDTAQDGVILKPSVDVTVTVKHRIDAPGLKPTHIACPADITPHVVQRDFSQKPMTLYLKSIRKPRKPIAKDSVTVPPGEGHSATALEMDVSQSTLQLRSKLISPHTFQNNHMHTASNVVSDEMRHDHSLGIDDNADRNRLSSMEIRRRCNGRDASNLFGQIAD
jgi:hypothetical protein